ncbi:UNVERIFIED_CONTAM: hypothetical protein HDU68_007736 [Siphonaria sp. JEL0065]|nr:hypothetical protein HDU68_007736 [Siphonaria sp. JEL0065]
MMLTLIYWYLASSLAAAESQDKFGFEKRDVYFDQSLSADLAARSSVQTTPSTIRNTCRSRNYRLFLNDCQYSLMLRLTSYFETTSTNLWKYLNALSQAEGICLSGSTQAVTPRGLENFCQDWRAAARDTVFQQAQQEVQYAGYFANLVEKFLKYNIAYPLTIAQMYDTSVQLGPGAVDQIASDATQRSGGIPGVVDESWWLTNYLLARSSYLDRLGGAYPGTKYRLDAYTSMLQNSNWHLTFGKSANSLFIKFSCWNTPTKAKEVMLARIFSLVLCFGLHQAVNAIGLKPEWLAAVNDKQDSYLNKATIQEVAGRDLPIATADELNEVPRETSRDGTDNLCKQNTYTNLLNDCQYKIMIRLTSYFETSSLNLGFGTCTTTNDGQGISAGFIQFTTCQGAVYKVCQRYTELSPYSFCADYVRDGDASILHKALHLYDCPGTGAYTPDGMWGFCDQWTAAAWDPLFQQAQLEVQYTGYFEPILRYIESYKVSAPLTIAQFFDTAVQLGPETVKHLADDATQRSGGVPGTVDESRWLVNYLNARDYYMVNVLGGAYANTLYRTDIYRNMLDNDNWLLAFSGSIQFHSKEFPAWGQIQTISEPQS